MLFLFTKLWLICLVCFEDQQISPKFAVLASDVHTATITEILERKTRATRLVGIASKDQSAIQWSWLIIQRSTSHKKNKDKTTPPSYCHFHQDWKDQLNDQTYS